MLKNGLLFFNINCSVDKRKEIFVRKKPFWYKSTFTRQTETDKPQRKKGGGSGDQFLIFEGKII